MSESGAGRAAAGMRIRGAEAEPSGPCRFEVHTGMYVLAPNDVSRIHGAHFDLECCCFSGGHLRWTFDPRDPG